MEATVLFVTFQTFCLPTRRQITDDSNLQNIVPSTSRSVNPISRFVVAPEELIFGALESM
jgi:hypothetical protein